MQRINCIARLHSLYLSDPSLYLAGQHRMVLMRL